MDGGNETRKEPPSFMELLLGILVANVILPLLMPFVLLWYLGDRLVHFAVWLYRTELRKPNPGS